MEDKAPKREIKCPQCGRLTFYSPENPSRPFCSERCRLIDLGQWADEKFRVPTDEQMNMVPHDMSDDEDDSR